MNKDNIFQHFLDLNLTNNVLYYVVGTIVLTLLVRKYLSRYIATLVYNLFKKTGRQLNKKAYYDLLVSPMQTFLVMFIILLSLEKLQLPATINSYPIYGKLNMGNLLQAISVMLLIIVFIRFLLSIIDYIAAILEDRANKTVGQDDNQLIVFFKDFFKVLLAIAGFLLILKYSFGQNIGNLLTGLSLVGAAVALATKESLENLIASFVIFFDKPFVTGDHVKVQHITGQVEKIGLRSTRIRTEDKTYVTVPNKQMVDSIVDNQSLRTKRKVAFKLELAKNTSIEKIQLFMQLLDKSLTKNNIIEEHTIFLAEVSKVASSIQVEYFTMPIADVDFNTVRQELNFAILQLLEQQEVSMAGTVTGNA
jgi:MscS family membrane protein